jgi:hypothetical protein
MVVAGTAFAATAAPASAASAVDPPGWTGVVPADGWAAFTITPHDLVPIGRTGTYQPVTLERHTNLTGADLEDAFNNWDDLDPSPLVVDLGWPTDFAAGGIALHQVAACPIAATECDYAVDPSSAGHSIFFFAGSVPIDSGTGLPAFDPEAEFGQDTLHLAPAPQVHAAFDTNLNPLPAQGGTAGKITLNAAGFSHDDLAGTTLAYEWIVQNLNTGKFFSATGATTDLTLDQNGTYCIQLKVTASDSATAETPACGTLASPVGYTFVADGFEPAAPAATPAPGAGGGGGSGGIVFARPVQRAPAAASVSAPTVVWLWRPDFFQPTADDTSAPKTTNRPKLGGRREIVVDAPAPDGASAGPWLAGVGLFGLIGGGLLLRRRRRLLQLPIEL